MQPSDAIHSDHRTPNDYIMAGDVIQLIPVGLDLPPLFLKTPPYVMVSGMVITSNENQAYIELEPEQFVSLLRACVPKPMFPIRCIFKDSPRWGTQKPKPSVGTYVTVGGFIQNVTRAKDGSIIQFHVDAEKVSYLGKALASPITSHSM